MTLIAENLETGLASDMAKRPPKPKKRLPDMELARRLAFVMRWCGCRTQTEFARRLGVSVSRINNVMVGYPLGGDLADTIFKKTGFPPDFLRYGIVDALSSAKRHDWAEDEAKDKATTLP